MSSEAALRDYEVDLVCQLVERHCSEGFAARVRRQLQGAEGGAPEPSKETPNVLGLNGWTPSERTGEAREARPAPPLDHDFQPSFDGSDRCAQIVHGEAWTTNDPIRCRRPAGDHPAALPIYINKLTDLRADLQCPAAREARPAPPLDSIKAFAVFDEQGVFYSAYPVAVRFPDGHGLHSEPVRITRTAAPPTQEKA